MPSPTDPLRSLTDGSFRFQMSLRPGEGAPFFAPTPHHGEVMAERRTLLAAQAPRYAAARPGTAGLLQATAGLVREWIGGDDDLPPVPSAGDAAALGDWCAQAGRCWEPDWVVMPRGEDGVYRLAAGCVCFPSGWALEDKLGRPLEEIHDPVPGLNAALGRQIHVFLERLKPGAVWWRDNWGLSADSALNHHPSLHLRPLTADARLTATWLRYEEQLLARLPESQDLLFGIRVGRVRLAEILPYPEVTRRLAEALRSMPDDVATYKGITPARASLLAQLDAVIP